MKIVKLFAVLFFVCATTLAYADPAAVIDDFGCSGFVPDDEGGFLAPLFTEESHTVVTAKGVTSLICHFDHEVEMDHATGAQGFLCGTQGGVTNDTKMFAAPGGRAVLVCKINGSSE